MIHKHRAAHKTLIIDHCDLGTEPPIHKSCNVQVFGVHARHVPEDYGANTYKRQQMQLYCRHIVMPFHAHFGIHLVKFVTNPANPDRFVLPKG